MESRSPVFGQDDLINQTRNGLKDQISWGGGWLQPRGCRLHFQRCINQSSSLRCAPRHFLGGSSRVVFRDRDPGGQGFGSSLDCFPALPWRCRPRDSLVTSCPSQRHCLHFRCLLQHRAVRGPFPAVLCAFCSQVRDTLRELDRLSAESWKREVEKAKAASREPARALSPSTAARVRAKLQARAVRNLPLRGPVSFDLDNLD